MVTFENVALGFVRPFQTQRYLKGENHHTLNSLGSVRPLGRDNCKPHVLVVHGQTTCDIFRVEFHGQLLLKPARWYSVSTCPEVE